MRKLLIVTTVSITLRSFFLPYARHFRRLGWRVDAAANGASRCPQTVEAFDRTWQVGWTRNPFSSSNWTGPVGQIRRLVDQEGYDLVHVHTPVSSFVTRLALRGRPRPGIIYTAHGFHFHPGGRLSKNCAFLTLEWMAGRWTDFLVVINTDDARAARRFRLAPQERIRYIPGVGVDTALFDRRTVPASEVSRVRSELRLKEDNPLFLMVAEFNPGKRHRDALQALRRLERPKVHLAFAGEGPLIEETRRLARILGLADQVHFLGFREDIPSLLSASLATLLPSEREGLPRSVMESLSLETPVIGANTRGIRDLLEQGGGIMVEVGDIPELAEAMATILDNREEAREMGRRGRKAMGRFALPQVLRLHESLYQEALRLAPG